MAGKKIITMFYRCHPDQLYGYWRYPSAPNIYKRSLIWRVKKYLWHFAGKCHLDKALRYHVILYLRCFQCCAAKQTKHPYRRC